MDREESELKEDLEVNENEQDENTSNPETSPRVMVGPHQLGGIEVIARSPSGDKVSTRIDFQEAAVLLAHLQALMTMFFQQIYMERAQAAQQIHIPGR